MSKLRGGNNVGWLKRLSLGAPDFASLTPDEFLAKEFGRS
jgi:hypothetical protein